jgi:transposase
MKCPRLNTAHPKEQFMSTIVESSPSVTCERRYISLDIHRQYAVVGGVNAQMKVVMKPKRVENEQLEVWIQEHLQPDDHVVIESTASAWHVYDLLAKRVAIVKVAHPQMVKLIAAAPVKTDGRDVLHLARLLAIGWLPEVWVSSQPVRELRSLLTDE